MFVQLAPFLEIHDAISKIIPKHLYVETTLKILTLVTVDITLIPPPFLTDICVRSNIGL